MTKKQSIEFDYIRKYYSMPWLRRGLIVEAWGKQGKVTRGIGHRIGVRFNGDAYGSRIHPQSDATYYDEKGNVIADYKKARTSDEPGRAMTNKEFYEFCRDRRKVEVDPSKRAALQGVYKYMLECGISRGGIKEYIAHAKATQSENDATSIAAYEWLLGVFNGTAEITQTQRATLWGEVSR